MQIHRLPAVDASVQPTDWIFPQDAVEAVQVIALLLLVVPPVPLDAVVLPADCVPAHAARLAETAWRE